MEDLLYWVAKYISAPILLLVITGVLLWASFSFIAWLYELINVINWRQLRRQLRRQRKEDHTDGNNHSVE